jgi:hypothetical protein
MPLDSIAGITKVAGSDCALLALWTKYGQWESEGPLMFEERPVQRQAGHLRVRASLALICQLRAPC